MSLTLPPIAGSISLAVVKLRRMVACSPTWRAAVGALSLDDAEQRVYLKDVRDTAERPLAIVSVGSNPISFKQIASGDQNVLSDSGSVFLYLAQTVSAQYFDDDVGAEIEAASFFGAVIAEVADLSGADDPASFDGTSHLSVVSISTVGFSGNPEDKWQSQGRFFYSSFELDWDL